LSQRKHKIVLNSHLSYSKYKLTWKKLSLAELLESWPKLSRPKRDRDLNVNRNDTRLLKPNVYKMSRIFLTLKFGQWAFWWVSEHFAISDRNFRTFWIAFDIFGWWNSSVEEINNTVKILSETSRCRDQTETSDLRDRDFEK